MSAINFVLRPDLLHVFADVACYYKDGTVGAWKSKILLLERFPCAVCTMGNAQVGMLVQDALGDCASFDELIQAVPAHFRDHAGDQDVAIAVGGYSEAGDGFEVWYGRTGSGQPFAKLPLGAGYGGQPPLTNEQWLRGFGKPMNTAAQIVDIDDFATTVLTLQREHKWGPAQGYPHDVHLVGGYGELATITRTVSDVRTIIEWPDDRVGELIKPTAINWKEWRRTHARQANPAPPLAPRMSRHERRAAKAKARKAA